MDFNVLGQLNSIRESIINESCIDVLHNIKFKIEEVYPTSSYALDIYTFLVYHSLYTKSHFSENRFKYQHLMDVEGQYTEVINKECGYVLNKDDVSLRVKHADRYEQLISFIKTKYCLQDYEISDSLTHLQKTYTKIFFEFDNSIDKDMFSYFIKAWVCHLYTVLMYAGESIDEVLTDFVRMFDDKYFEVGSLYTLMCSQDKPDACIAFLYVIWLVEFHDIKDGKLSRLIIND